MFEVPTIRIVSSDPEHTGGFIVINASDFDASIHTEWKPKPAKAKAKSKADAGTDDEANNP